ncbi:MAG: radical SAM protein, partial [Dehalococcoidales bacterium]|nr:radical SAM protein [Dehalococcoidales bacterium]
MNDEFAFRYKLDLPQNKTGEYAHRPAELIRAILEAVFNVAVPLEKGQDLAPDSFRWLMDRANQYRIFPNKETPKLLAQPETNPGYQSNIQTAFSEPRIDLVKKTMESLLEVVEFERDGQKVTVDGFRLKNLADWTVAGAGDPRDVFEYLGSRCNCDCVFCCNKGNLPETPAGARMPDAGIEELKTRLAYYSPDSGRSLLPAANSVYEVTIHPQFIETLRLLRKKTAKPFRITTNGCSLTPEMISSLAEVKPVYLYLSLNSCRPERREALMADKIPERVIKALPLLKKAGIPFAAVIVPWPANGIPAAVADLKATIDYVARFDPHIVQVNLPGYTSYFSDKEIFNLDDLWSQVVTAVRDLRNNYDFPIVNIPAMYEENRYYERKNVATVIGIMKNSPAYFSGIKPGDVITRVNGIPVSSRPQARDLLTLAKGEREQAVVQVNREGARLKMTINTSKHEYPYQPEIDGCFGLVFLGNGFRISYLEELARIIQAHNARQVLFFSSELVKPVF